MRAVAAVVSMGLGESIAPCFLIGSVARR
jgi:hypothetical protein